MSDRSPNLHDGREEILGRQPLRDGVGDGHDGLRAPVGHAGLQLVQAGRLLAQRRLERVGERLLEGQGQGQGQG